MLDFDAIDDTLIIGSAFVADDVPLLAELNVRAVVSLQSEAPDPVEHLERHGIEWARIGCEDFRAPSLGQIEDAVTAITHFVDRGHRVYLHCFAGLQRAVTIAACYFIARDFERYNARSALDLVIQKRRHACPLREQIDAVLDFDRYIKTLRRSDAADRR
jgi:protein-tyrosine phosphatase